MRRGQLSREQADALLAGSTVKDRIKAARSRENDRGDARSIFGHWLEQDLEWRVHRLLHESPPLEVIKAPGAAAWPVALAQAVWRAIALEGARATGLRVRGEDVHLLKARAEEIVDRESPILHGDEELRACFRWNDDQSIYRSPQGKLRAIERNLPCWLDRFAKGKRDLADMAVAMPRTTDGKPSSLPEDWASVAWGWPEIEAWMALQSACSVLNLVGQSAGAPEIRLRPTYDVEPHLVSRGPDLALLRRLVDRPIFVADPGHHLLAIDLPQLELRCHVDHLEQLDAVGRTPLGDLIRAEDRIRDWVEQLEGWFEHDSDRGRPEQADSRADWAALCRGLSQLLSSSSSVGEPELRSWFGELPGNPRIGGDRGEFEGQVQRIRDEFDRLDDTLQSVIRETLDCGGTLASLLGTRLRRILESDQLIDQRIIPELCGNQVQRARAAQFFQDCVLQLRSHREVRLLARRELGITLSERDAGQVLGHVAALLGSLGWFEAEATVLRDWFVRKLGPGGGSDTNFDEFDSSNPFFRESVSVNSRRGPEERERFWSSPLCSWRGEEDANLIRHHFDRSFTWVHDRGGKSPVPLIVWAYCLNNRPVFERYAAHQPIARAVTDAILFELAANGRAPRAVAGHEILLQRPGGRPGAPVREQVELLEIRRIVMQAAVGHLQRIPVRCEVRYVPQW